MEAPMDLISLLVTLIVYGIVLGILWWAIEQIPFIQPFAWAVRVLFALIVALLILGMIGGGVPTIGHGVLIR
jgi:hypothetical protein